MVTLLAQSALGAPATIFVLAVFFQADLHLTKTQIGFLNSALSLGVPVSLLAAGWITDRLGTRRMLVAGLLLTGLATGAASLTPSFTAGLPLFLITGIAIGVAVPSLVKSIVIWFPPKERGFAMGIMRTGVPLMGALAAATLPSVALSFGWRTAVVALAAVIMICGAMVFVLYRENSTTTEQERGGTVPLGKLLRNRNILLGSILPAILTGAQFSLASYFMLYLIEVLDIPVVVAGEIMAIIQVSGAVGRVLWGVVSDRVFASFRKQVLILIGVISAILLAIMSFLPTGVPLWAMILVAIGLGALLLGWHAVYTVLLPELAGKELAGSAVGLGYTLIQVGAVTGPPLFGYIVDVTGGYRWAWAFLALLVGGGIPLLLPVKEEQKR